MIYQIDNKEYPVIINKKNNKNTYIRITDNLEINVTTNYFTTKWYIRKLLNNNYENVKKMVNRKEKVVNKRQEFYYLGHKYDIMIMPTMKSITFEDNKIYVESNKYLNNWYKKQMIEIFNERLKHNYDLFDEKIPFPNLKLRAMKTRWGVCNTKTKTITLNSLLLKETLDKMDYVIIHELSHLIHPNHSKSFWLIVEKYCPNYKNLRKGLKE